MSSVSVPGLTALTYNSANGFIESSGVYGNGLTYTWSIDAVNQFGITTGDSWTFTTIKFKPPTPTYHYSFGDTNFYYQLLPQTDGTWGTSPPDGTENVDYIIVASPNLILTHKFIIAASGNAIWFQEI